MFPQNNIVLIGNSVVEQSKSIAHLKKRVINIDSYNDEDLIGEAYKNPNPYGLVNDDVLSILKDLNLKKSETLIIVSSDYERGKNFHKELQSYGKIIGNSSKTIKNLQDHKSLILKLQRNNIKTPEIFSDIKGIHKSVLIKNSYMSGGLGIKKLKDDSEKCSKDEYYQKYIEGPVFSILFISDNKKNYKIIGVNKIYNKKTMFSDFCFSGALSNVEINEDQTQCLKNMINFFINDYDLVGINGIDFIINKDVYFLEINPRITQTCFLYDKAFNDGFIDAHINASLNDILLVDKKKCSHIACFENLFAYSSFVIKTDLKEFSFVSNIPKINNHIEVGEPICTINSISDDEKKAKKLLLDNISLVKDKLITAEII